MIKYENKYLNYSLENHKKGRMPKTKKIGNILNYVFDGWKCRDFCEEAKGPDPTGLGLNCSDEVKECLQSPEIRNDINIV